YLLASADGVSAVGLGASPPEPPPAVPVNDDGTTTTVSAAQPGVSLQQPANAPDVVTLNRSSVISDQSAAIRVAGGTATTSPTGPTLTGAAVLEVISRNEGGATLPGIATLTADSSPLTGTALTATGSQSTLNLSNGSRWNVTGNSVVTTLT